MEILHGNCSQIGSLMSTNPDMNPRFISEEYFVPGSSLRNTSHLAEPTLQLPLFPVVNSTRLASGVSSFMYYLCTSVLTWPSICWTSLSRFHTTTNFTAEEVHTLGNREVTHLSFSIFSAHLLIPGGQHWGGDESSHQGAPTRSHC